MDSKKVIAVVGATGNQGSSVAHTFLSLPSWHVRCLTRNPLSTAAQALSTQGAEVVKADLSDLTSLSEAFKGAHAIFLNTDFWATYVAANAASHGNATLPGDGKSSSELGFDEEVLHGKNAAIAAAAVPSLERLVYSALGPMKKHSKGKYPHSYHWESKAAIVEYIENEQPELANKTSFIYLGGYTTNPMLTPRLDPKTGKYAFVLPASKETRMPIIDQTKSTGPFVRALVENEDAGVKLLAYDDYFTLGEFADLWSRVTGVDAAFVGVSAEFMNQQFGIPIEVLDGPRYIEEFGYMGGIDGAIEPFQLKKTVETKSFEEWLRASDWKKTLETAEAEIASVAK